MTGQLMTGGGRVSFRASSPDGAGVRVEAGNGVVFVDCITAASYIGAVLDPGDARRMAHALTLAAEAAEAAGLSDPSATVTT